MQGIAYALVVAGVIVLIGLWLCDLLNVPLPGPLERLHQRGLFGVLVVALLVMVLMVLAMIAIDVGTKPER